MRSIVVAMVMILVQSPALAAVPRCERTENPFYATLSLGPSAELGTESLSRDGFTIRLVEEIDMFEQARVERDGRLVLQWPEPMDEGDRAYTSFGIVPFLASDQQVLMISYWSGGVHCCNYLRMHLLDPDLPLIFDSSQYVHASGRGEIAQCDLDGDGYGEIILNSTAFDAFQGLPGVMNPIVPVVFRYDEGRRVYVPANREFPEVSRRDDARLIEELRDIEPTKHPQWILSVLLRLMKIHLYAGEERKAWELFEIHYTPEDRQQIRLEIESRLKEDGLYQAVKGAPLPAVQPAPGG